MKTLFLCASCIMLVAMCNGQSTAPPVIQRLNAENWEMDWHTELQRQSLPTTDPVDRYYWHSRISFPRTFGFGELSGASDFTITATLGRTTITAIMDYKYVQYPGYWPFIISDIYSRAWAGALVKGGELTQYGWKATVKTFDTNISTNGDGKPYEYRSAVTIGAGLLHDWNQLLPYQEVSGVGTTVGPIISYMGEQYSTSYNTVSLNLHSGFGCTGPTQPAYVVGGKLKVISTFEVFKLEGVPPVTKIGETKTAGAYGFEFDGLKSFTVESYDPDNPGDTARKGIVLNDWTLVTPEGETVTTSNSYEFELNLKTWGRYTVSLRSYDDEGMSTEKTYSFTALPRPKYKFGEGETSVGTLGW